MITFALSLQLAAAQPQNNGNGWIWAAGFAGAAMTIAAAWSPIMRDEPNQPPRLSVVPDPVAPVAPDNDDDDHPAVNSLDANDEPPPRPPDVQAPPLEVDWKELAQLYSLPDQSQPGVVNVDQIRGWTVEQRKTWILEYFQENNLGYLLQCLKSTPIVIYGLQRSGKNTLAYTIAALRRVLFPQPIIVCSPHANRDNPPPAAFLRAGYDPASGVRWEEIAAYLRTLYGWTDGGDVATLTHIWDEVSIYKRHFADSDLPLLSRFFLFLLSATEKHNKFQIVLSSGLTNDCLPGAEGTANLRGQGMISIGRVALTGKYGDRTPSPQIEIEGLNLGQKNDGRQSEIFPDWLSANWIFNLFPECNSPLEIGLNLPLNLAPPPETISPGAKLLKFPNQADFGGGDGAVSVSGNFPKWYADMDSAGKKILFNLLNSNLQSGKNKTQIITQIFAMKGENYRMGAAIYDDLLSQFGDQSTGV